MTIKHRPSLAQLADEAVSAAFRESLIRSWVALENIIHAAGAGRANS
jgi:hypothetical protein